MEGFLGRNARQIGLSLLIMAQAPFSTSAVHAAQHGSVLAVPGWTLRFGDDFNGTAGTPPSPADWKVALGHGEPGMPSGWNWGTGEVEAYSADPSNLSVDGKGHLRITPQRNAAGEWTSARIFTARDDFLAPAGGMLRIEARIRLPDVFDAAARGYWPAFWALGSSFRTVRNWPHAGEIDILENVNGMNTVWGTLHCGTYPNGPCNEPSGISGRIDCALPECRTAFHTYGFEWDRSKQPEQLRWYLDGREFHSISQSRLPAATWEGMTSHSGFFMLLNVAIGGYFVSNEAGVHTPTPDTEPGHAMVVDYVAVWTRRDGPKKPFPLLRSVAPE